MDQNDAMTTVVNQIKFNNWILYILFFFSIYQIDIALLSAIFIWNISYFYLLIFNMGIDLFILSKLIFNLFKNLRF